MTMLSASSRRNSTSTITEDSLSEANSTTEETDRKISDSSLESHDASDHQQVEIETHQSESNDNNGSPSTDFNSNDCKTKKVYTASVTLEQRLAEMTVPDVVADSTGALEPNDNHQIDKKVEEETLTSNERQTTEKMRNGDRNSKTNLRSPTMSDKFKGIKLFLFNSNWHNINFFLLCCFLDTQQNNSNTYRLQSSFPIIRTGRVSQTAQMFESQFGKKETESNYPVNLPTSLPIKEKMPSVNSVREAFTFWNK